MKSWLYNHNGNSEKGGIANIYFSFYNDGFNPLPDDSPEAGKMVIWKLWEEIGHAMTIVGYNDEICFDFNEDGRYTTNIDINNDGIISTMVRPLLENDIDTYIRFNESISMVKRIKSHNEKTFDSCSFRSVFVDCIIGISI